MAVYGFNIRKKEHTPSLFALWHVIVCGWVWVCVGGG